MNYPILFVYSQWLYVLAFIQKKLRKAKAL